MKVRGGGGGGTWGISLGWPLHGHASCEVARVGDLRLMHPSANSNPFQVFDKSHPDIFKSNSSCDSAADRGPAGCA